MSLFLSCLSAVRIRTRESSLGQQDCVDLRRLLPGLPGPGYTTFVVIHVLEAGKYAAESSPPIDHFDVAFLVRAFSIALILFPCAIARARVPDIDADPAMAVSDLSNRRQRRLPRRLRCPRMKKPVVHGLLELQEGVAPAIVVTAVLENIGVD